jgi:hypothetical protein
MMQPPQLVKISDVLYKIGETGWKIELGGKYLKSWFVFGDGQYLPVKEKRSVTWQYACKNNLPDYDFAFSSVEEAYQAWLKFDQNGRVMGGKL